MPQPQSYQVEPVDARIAEAAAHLRTLHEAGEIDWSDVHPLAAFEMAFIDDEPEQEEEIE
jgi:hypothetical protein